MIKIQLYNPDFGKTNAEDSLSKTAYYIILVYWIWDSANMFSWTLLCVPQLRCDSGFEINLIESGDTCV